jgi:dynein heavy chain
MIFVCRLGKLHWLLSTRRYENSHEQLPEAKLERLFLYCLCWSLGGLLSEKERPAFDNELRGFGSNMPPK